jgi:DNA-binding PadR family transcriptional regulator
MSDHDTQPLSEPVFYALLALAERPSHGYGIILRVEEWTGGRVRLRTATLYTALSRLREAGLVEEADVESGAGEDARRGTVYGLTGAGRDRVRAETRRIRALADLAAAVIT